MSGCIIPDRFYKIKAETIVSAFIEGGDLCAERAGYRFM